MTRFFLDTAKTLSNRREIGDFPTIPVNIAVGLDYDKVDISKYCSGHELFHAIPGQHNKYNEELNMAKSFLDQLLGLAGLKLPDGNGHYNPSVYKDETAAKAKAQTKTVSDKPGLTGVSRYLAAKFPEKEVVELTGVAKYLAKHQKAETGAAAPAEALTGVAKYMAKHGGAGHPAPTPAPAPKLTGVDKYLAQKKVPAPVPPVAEKPAPKPAPAPAKAPPPPAPVVEAKKKEPAAPKEEVKAPAATAPAPATQAEAASTSVSDLIDLAGGAEQCQAATMKGKGSQCKRSSNLDAIELTIDGQKYRFAACSQHNNSDFVPVEGLI
ncbi:MAG: hypothetical protein ACU84J_09960 [Gammaproteobacteria bacterium]